MIRRGRRWEEPTSGGPDLVVEGSDQELALVARQRPGVRVELRPTGPSDLARTIGRDRGRRTAVEEVAGDRGPDERPAVALDLLLVDGDGEREPASGTPRGTATHAAVSSVVLGTPPHHLGVRSRTARFAVVADGRVVHDGPALAVVVANGQFLDGRDVAPRGHPGDGRFELQVYGPLRRAERAELRRRVRTGSHVPHPRITQQTARHAVIEVARPRACALDRVPIGRRRRLEITLRAGAYHLVL